MRSYHEPSITATIHSIALPPPITTDGSYFHYSYDAVGNRLSEGTLDGSSVYAYDAANRLIDVDGVAHTWDANGNLLSDGTSSYSYNTANRLVSVSQGGDAYTFAYNGLGDRLQQVVNGDPTTYTLDLNTGLTQVLADGANAYLYGLGRIGEQQPQGWMYHLTDALGSVRQLSGPDAVLALAQSYEPFGDILVSAGNGESVFQYTGQARDATGLTFLRARYYNSLLGSFFQKDPWRGSIWEPGTMQSYSYVGANPILRTDPSGEQWVNPQIGGGEGIIVTCYEIAFLIHDPIPVTEGICTLIFFGVVAAIALPVMLNSAQEVAEYVGTITEKLMDDCDTRQYPLWIVVPEADPEHEPETDPIPLGSDVFPRVDETPRPKWVLYHYTSSNGFVGILASQSILPSLGEDGRAAYGHGQYFTDIAPAEAASRRPYQLSRALFNIQWFNDKVTHFVGIDVSELAIDRVDRVHSNTYGSRSIYIHRSEIALSVGDRIESSGQVIFTK